MRLLLAAALLALAPAARADEKPEAKARAAALELLKAVKAKDADAVLKLTAVPFAYKDGDRPKVFKEEAQVKAWVKDRLAGVADPAKVPTDLAALLPFTEVADKIENADDRKLVEGVVGKDGFVALIDADGKTVIVLVKVTDGKAKVVGIGH